MLQEGVPAFDYAAARNNAVQFINVERPGQSRPALQMPSSHCCTLAITDLIIHQRLIGPQAIVVSSWTAEY